MNAKMSVVCAKLATSKTGTELRTRAGGEKMTKFELQRLGIWDITPEFQQEFDFLYGDVIRSEGK